MSSHEQAARLAVLKVLAEQMKAAKTSADSAVTGSWRPKDRTTAVLPTGDEIGTVTLASGRKTARLSDEAAFLAWVKATHPDEMETVTITRPNPQFVARLMSAAQKLGHPVDAATGEEVPGITVVEGEPCPVVKLSPDAAEIVAKRWQSGGLVELVGSLLRPTLGPGGDS